MSFFSRLFGTSQPEQANVAPDSIWLTRQAKHAALGRELRRADHSNAVAILLVAHFADTLSDIEAIVDQYKGQTPAMAVLAADLSSRAASGLASDPNQTIELIVAERHPLTTVDDQVLTEFAEQLPCQFRASYHIALDEPLMAVFAGESVTRMLEALGMDANEKIESRMVSKRIRQAQKRLSEKATGNRSADSMQQWLDLNLPPTNH